ncbi:malonate decarboxylase subunit epsilon [Legionella sp. 16cNR16C]|uniref:malonate decarboxylase subunit epsilon n=1 Tax=Legionella sp. 16cNR16C TaxID=2905656 RepID=UPI001E5C6874|nr:malonate decarboxylase subunit epsilon [Legionella sp. 16cNR16C]MCE3044722.1 malonate decarboxylase subunit epsilon [Legionella sp. 16cNR16C]
MRILFLFAGQGYQNNTLFDFFQQGDEADDLLGTFSSLAQLDLLSQPLPIDNPRWVQIIIGCYQLILFARVKPLLTNHQVELAGYSLGEASAFLASINASPERIIELLHHRSQLMNTLVSGTEDYDLITVKGEFDWKAIQILIAEYHCYIAIINSPQHLVIGGKCADLKRLASRLSTEGLRLIKFLNIQLPSHTPFYRQASVEFQHFLNGNFQADVMQYPVISPLKLRKIYKAEEERDLLGLELQECLDWFNVCNLIKEYQYDLIVDLGPGDSLSKILNASRKTLTAELLTASRYHGFDGFLQVFQKIMES